jgi:hypothetical protein
MLALLTACRDRHSAPSSFSPPAPTPSSEPAHDAAVGAPSPARVVCAPVQGPTRARRELPDGAIVVSADGKVALSFESEPDGSRSSARLRAPNEPDRRTKLPGNDPLSPDLTFQGENVIGFGRSAGTVSGGRGYVVWATLRPRALFSSVVGWTAARAGSRVHFNDEKCMVHTLDLATGNERAGPAKVCDWFRLWGEGLAVGESKISQGYVTAIELGGTVLSPDTGRALPKPHCPHPVGAGCVTFGDDLRVSVDDDPAGPASSSSRSETFEVSGPHGEHVRGEISLPHAVLSPDHARLWRDAAGRTFALVAARVDGSTGPQLVVVDDVRVSVTPLSADDATDQRRILALRALVPAATLPEDVSALLRERQSVLGASTGDRVRFMEYAAAASAQVPCTAPPR